jgi:hypothetical protein
MLSKLSRSSNKRCDNLGLGTPHNKRCNNLGLGTPHNKISESVDPTHRKKDKENMDSIMTTIPMCKKRRTPERQRKMPGSGETSIILLGITLLIYTQRSHWRLK